MWKLSAPTCETTDEELETALTYANGRKKFAYSDTQRAWLLEAYEHYDEMRGRPSQAMLARHLGQPFLEALHGAYDEVQQGGRLASLRSELKIHVQKCPYCGFGEVRDLDHQLPRRIYKAFSIYPKNLVPCCHPCNNKKRSVAGDDPEAQFPHIYLDEMPAERFFFAEADVSEAGLHVRFLIRRCAGMPDDLLHRLGFLVERLELEERYQAEVINFITSQRPALELAATGGEPSLREYLRRCFEGSIRDYGLNHWQTALWESLAGSDAFCEGGYRHCFGLARVGA